LVYQELIGLSGIDWFIRKVQQLKAYVNLEHRTQKGFSLYKLRMRIHC